MTKAIVSYDGTPNDQDALEAGRLLSDAGVQLVLAYVRHTVEDDPQREEQAAREARARLERGAQWLGDPHVEQRVTLSASTADGLAQLAEEEDAAIMVFGSAYRTPAGHVAPQQSTQTLLEGARTAVAIAPANYRQHEALCRVGLVAAPGDDAALDTAFELARSMDARVTRDEPFVDVIVMGSRPEAPVGRVMLSAHAQRQLETARCPVLVVPRGISVRFPATVGLT